MKGQHNFSSTEISEIDYDDKILGQPTFSTVKEKSYFVTENNSSLEGKKDFTAQTPLYITNNTNVTSVADKNSFSIANITIEPHKLESKTVSPFTTSAFALSTMFSKLQNKTSNVTIDEIINSGTHISKATKSAITFVYPTRRTTFESKSTTSTSASKHKTPIFKEFTTARQTAASRKLVNATLFNLRATLTTRIPFKTNITYELAKIKKQKENKKNVAYSEERNHLVTVAGLFCIFACSLF